MVRNLVLISSWNLCPVYNTLISCHYFLWTWKDLVFFTTFPLLNAFIRESPHSLSTLCQAKQIQKQCDKVMHRAIWMIKNLKRESDSLTWHLHVLWQARKIYSKLHFEHNLRLCLLFNLLGFKGYEKEIELIIILIQSKSKTKLNLNELDW